MSNSHKDFLLLMFDFVDGWCDDATKEYIRSRLTDPNSLESLTLSQIYGLADAATDEHIASLTADALAQSRSTTPEEIEQLSALLPPSLRFDAILATRRKLRPGRNNNHGVA